MFGIRDCSPRTTPVMFAIDFNYVYNYNIINLSGPCESAALI